MIPHIKRGMIGAGELFEQLIRANEEAVDNRCPRASCAAMLVDLYELDIYSIGVNNVQGGCACDQDDTDTLVGPSTTCRATHAEVAALLAGPDKFVGVESTTYGLTMLCLRPPCKNCIKALLCSAVEFIIVTNEWDDRDLSKARWRGAGRRWAIVDKDNPRRIISH